MNRENQSPDTSGDVNVDIQELSDVIDPKDVRWYETIAGYLSDFQGSRLSIDGIDEFPESGEVSITFSGTVIDLNRFTTLTTLYHEVKIEEGKPSSDLAISAALKQTLDLQVIRSQGS